MPRARSITPPAANGSLAATGSSAPKGRKTTAQGIALGNRPTTNPSTEGAAQGWRIAKISDFAMTTSGGTPSRANPEFYTGTIPWIKSGDLNDGNVSDATEFITEEALKSSSAKLFPVGTLMIALYGATIGKLGILTIEAATNQAVCGIFVPEGVETKYLFYFLLKHRRELIKQGAGGAQPNISQGIVRDVEVPIAPLPEQRRIVARIEELFSRLDAGVAALRHAKAQLQRYRQSVLAAAVTGQLTQAWREQHGLTMEDWRQTTLGDESALVTSGSRGWAKYYAEDGPPFVRAQNIKTDALVLDDLAHVRPPAGSEGARTQVFENDLLITITGANVTKSALVKQPLGEAYVSQHVALVRPVNPDHAPFLYYAIISPRNGRAFLEEKAYGAGKPGLNLTNVKEVPIGLPPLAEQRQIVAEVEARTTAIDHLEAELDRQITRSNRLRQSTLRAAFEGNLDYPSRSFIA
jgi:type I restriction enzyme, S subunit